MSEVNQGTMNSSEPPKRVQELMEFSEQVRLFLLEFLEAGRYLLEKGVRKSLARVKEEVTFLWKRFTALDFVCGNLSLAAFSGGLLVSLAGFALIGYQAVLWLMDGVWTEMPLMVVFNFLFEDTALHQWLQTPESWFGLHQVVEWNLTHVPVSLVLIVDGAAIAAFMAMVIMAALLVRRFQFKHRAH